MLTVVSKRPGSLSLQTSPAKRLKTPSPQKQMLQGIYHASPTPFHSKLQKITLSESIVATPKLVNSFSSVPSFESSKYEKNPSPSSEEKNPSSLSDEKNPSSLPDGKNPSSLFDEKNPFLLFDEKPPSAPSMDEMNDSTSFTRKNTSASPSNEESVTSESDSSPATHIIRTNQSLKHDFVHQNQSVITNLQHSINSIDFGFTLINANKKQRSPTRAEVRTMCEVYPGIRQVLHFPPYLRIVCETIPVQIPRSIGGIPCRFTTDFNEIPLQGTFCRGPAISVGDVCPEWILPPFDTRKKIAEALVKYGVRSVAWLGTRWLLDVESEDVNNKRKLPCKINGLITSYRCRPTSRENSLRHIFPSRTEIDNTDYYPNLHAGMLVFQGGQDGGYTTSGCPVKNSNYPNERFFTVASHGFVLGSEIVHPHGPPDGRIIGIVDKEMGDSDISLAKIFDPTITYTDESFSGLHGTIRLARLRKETESMLGEELYFDSPFTGLGVGEVVGHGIDVYPKDSNREEWAFVSNIWTDFNAGVYDPVSGCCGTPLFDQKGNVVAFFRWFDDGGISRCPCTDPLIDAGWELANFDSPVSGVPDDTDTYEKYIEKTISSYIASSSGESPETLSSQLSVSHSPLENEIKKRLVKLQFKPEIAAPCFFHSATLESWYEKKNDFPEEKDIKERVKGGVDAIKMPVEEWENCADYDDVIQIVKDAAQTDEIWVYVVEAIESKFVLFILARVENGLIGVRWNSGLCNTHYISP